MGHWVCAYTKPFGELWAAEGACARGFLPYLPRFLDERGKAKILFPRYLFVFIDEAWRILKSTYGIIRLVMEGDHPRPVPDRVISDLMSGEGPDGFFKTPDRFRRG